MHDDLHKEDADRSGGSGIWVSGISHFVIDFGTGWLLGVGDKLSTFTCDDTVRIPPGQGLRRPS